MRLWALAECQQLDAILMVHPLLPNLSYATKIVLLDDEPATVAHKHRPYFKVTNEQDEVNQI